MKYKSKKQKWAGIFFVLPEFLGVSIFTLIPFVDVMHRAFLRSDGSFCGFDNFQQIFRNKAFLLAAGNTLCFSVMCLPLLLLVSLLAAISLQTMGKMGGLLKSSYLLPMAIPTAAVVLIWKLFFDSHGLMNRLISLFEADPIDFMNTSWAFWVLVFSYLWKNLGYTVLLWSAGLSGISESIYEAGKMDGANTIQRFRYLTLPNLRQSAFTIVVISIINSFKVFREAYLVGGNYPQESIYQLQHLFNNWFRKLSMDKMSAASVVLFLVLTILVIGLQRSWERER